MFTDDDFSDYNFLPFDRIDQSALIDGLRLNCSLPAILEFPNFMRRKSWWGTVISLFLSLYLFIILAIVCQDYLLPAMERLCYAWKISYDVAGASFLATATSAPELFINSVGTFITQGDIGVGTIVGSSVFNILVIAAVCGILTEAIKLDWWPVTRDICWYLLSIAALLGVLWDSLVPWYEALILLSLYIVYFLQLLFDKRVQRLFRNNVEEEVQEDPMSPDSEEGIRTFREHMCGVPKKGSNCCLWFWWIVKYPAEVILALTIPSARAVYPLTLVMSIAWISVISYLVTWFLTIFGHNLSIPDAIMGFTIVAAGTSVPEVVSSFIVSKRGRGSMAISNAIGSNTFNILICLGMPWLLRALITGTVVIQSKALSLTTAMLVITAAIMYFTLLGRCFMLGKIVGWVSIVIYAIFVVISCCLEMLLYTRNTCNIEEAGNKELLNF